MYTAVPGTPPRTVASDTRYQHKLGIRGGYYRRHHIYKNHKKSITGDQLCAIVDRLSEILAARGPRRAAGFTIILRRRC